MGIERHSDSEDSSEEDNVRLFPSVLIILSICSFFLFQDVEVNVCTCFAVLNHCVCIPFLFFKHITYQRYPNHTEI